MRSDISKMYITDERHKNDFIFDKFICGYSTHLTHGLSIHEAIILHFESSLAVLFTFHPKVKWSRISTVVVQHVKKMHYWTSFNPILDNTQVSPAFPSSTSRL